MPPCAKYSRYTWKGGGTASYRASWLFPDVPPVDPEDKALRLGSSAHTAQDPFCEPFCEEGFTESLPGHRICLAEVGITYMAALSTLPLVHAHDRLPA